jgi:hypothetical protein
MAGAQLWDMVPRQGFRTGIDAMASYVGELADGLYPGDSRMHVYAALSGQQLFHNEVDVVKSKQDSPIPESLERDQIEDWLTGRMALGACVINERMGRLERRG